MANSYPASGQVILDDLKVCTNARLQPHFVSYGEHMFMNLESAHNNSYLPVVTFSRAGCTLGAIGLDRASNSDAIGNYAESEMVIGTRANTPTSIQSGGVRRMVISSGGNISIGATSPFPSPKVDIRTSCPLTSAVGQPIFLGSNDVTGPLGIVIQHLCGHGVCRADITSTRYGVSGNDLSLNVDSSDPNTAGGLYIKYRGNVGIGTSSPNTPLQIRNSSVSSGGSGLSVYGFDGAMEVYTTRAESPANAAIYLYNRPTSGTNGTGTGISFRASSTNTADRAQGGFYSSWTDTTDATRTSKFFFDLVCGGTYATRMTLLGTGHLGVGTTTPGARVDVCGADGRIQSRVDSSDGSTINIRPNAGKCGWISYTEDAVADRWGIGIKNGDGALYFASGNVGVDGGTTRMTLTSTGAIGLGTASPASRFHITHTGAEGACAIILQSTNSCGNGTISWRSSAGVTQAQIGSNYNVGDPAGNLEFITSASTRLLVTSAGCVGIGTASPSYRLHVNGTFYAAGSSIDYKEGICQYNTDSCLFMCLKPVTYQYKDEYTHLGKELKSETQIGLIAEDVADVYPELAILVNEDEQKVVRNVDYEKLSIILLSEVQKLRKEVDNLKNNK